MHYYAPDGLDHSAKLVDAPSLVIPERAYKERLRGKVKLAIYINSNGAVDGIELIDSTPPGIYESAVIAATLRSRYAPAEILGHKVPSRKVVEFDLDPYETIERP